MPGLLFLFLSIGSRPRPCSLGSVTPDVYVVFKNVVANIPLILPVSFFPSFPDIQGLLDPLEVHLLDFPNIVIKGSELQLPFQPRCL